jgi:hypothetical protein
MWANVWYYLGSQLITLVSAFGMSLCFESPFIRLEKLWIGALLQAIMPSKKDHVKKNGLLAEQQTVNVLDEIIERFDKEDIEKRQQMDKTGLKEGVPNGYAPGEKEKVQDNVHGDYGKEIEKQHENGDARVREDDKKLAGVGQNLDDTLTVAEVHIQDQSLPAYEEIIDK